jgi:hypothetical protein
MTTASDAEIKFLARFGLNPGDVIEREWELIDGVPVNTVTRIVRFDPNNSERPLQSRDPYSDSPNR